MISSPVLPVAEIETVDSIILGSKGSMDRADLRSLDVPSMATTFFFMSRESKVGPEHNLMTKKIKCIGFARVHYG